MLTMQSAVTTVLAMTYRSDTHSNHYTAALHVFNICIAAPHPSYTGSE